MGEREIVVCRDVADLKQRAAEHFITIASLSVRRSGRFTVALSGGSTPKQLYSLLAQAGYRERIAWSRIHFFWVTNAVSRRIIRKATIEWLTNRSYQKSTSRLKMTIE
jgi:6-phosphogluconolactonase/glucosamine-6-phosphate isomerase/deaminase